MSKAELIKKYETIYGVKTVPYDCTKRLPKNKVAIEVCDDGTIIEHSAGGTNYVKI